MLLNRGREKCIGHQLSWESDSPVYVAATAADGMTPSAEGALGEALAVVGESSAFQRGARPPAQMPICAVSHLGSHEEGGAGGGGK